MWIIISEVLITMVHAIPLPLLIYLGLGLLPPPVSLSCVFARLCPVYMGLGTPNSPWRLTATDVISHLAFGQSVQTLDTGKVNHADLSVPSY